MTKIKMSQFKPLERFKYEIHVNATVYPIDRNGNTYNRVIIYDNTGDELYDSGKTYGYGSAYEQTAFAWIVANVAIPKKFVDKDARGNVNAAYTLRAAREAKYLKVHINVNR